MAQAKVKRVYESTDNEHKYTVGELDTGLHVIITGSQIVALNEVAGDLYLTGKQAKAVEGLTAKPD